MDARTSASVAKSRSTSATDFSPEPVNRIVKRGKHERQLEHMSWGDGTLRKYIDSFDSRDRHTNDKSVGKFNALFPVGARLGGGTGKSEHNVRVGNEHVGGPNSARFSLGGRTTPWPRREGRQAAAMSPEVRRRTIALL